MQIIKIIILMQLQIQKYYNILWTITRKHYMQIKIYFV